MKHKVGDKVRIKSLDWYNENKNRFGSVLGFMQEMSKYCGKQAFITKCAETYYELDIDDGDWYWNDEMFDETFKENKMEKKELKITLPKNYEASEVNANIQNGCIVVEYVTKEKFVPKNGDVIYLESDSGTSWISIYKSKNNKPYDDSLWDYCSINIRNKDLDQAPSWIQESSMAEIRLATEEEKNLLFDALKSKNLQWNAEEKRLDKIRWRAEYGGTYYYVSSKSRVEIDMDYKQDTDDIRYDNGNYFKTKEEAQKYADEIKELFKNR